MSSLNNSTTRRSSLTTATKIPIHPPSPCIDTAVDNYLIDLETPATSPSVYQQTPKSIDPAEYPTNHEETADIGTHGRYIRPHRMPDIGGSFSAVLLAVSGLLIAMVAAPAGAKSDARPFKEFMTGEMFWEVEVEECEG